MKKDNNSDNKKRPTHKQAVILKAKQEHPDLTTRQIAVIANTTHPHVIRTLRGFGLETRRDLDLYKKHRADILAGVQADQISTYYTLSEKEKKKLILSRGLVDMGISFDKERLERGLSTENLVSVIADIEALKAAKKAEDD